MSEEQRQRLASAFLAAAVSGDVDQIRDLLAADAVMYSDGGGVVTAARKPIYGAARIAKFYVTVRRTGRFPTDLRSSPVTVNGSPGVRLVSRSNGPYAITAIEVVDDQVQTIRNFLNPDRFLALGGYPGSEEDTHA